jgi:hypothetical protein
MSAFGGQALQVCLVPQADIPVSSPGVAQGCKLAVMT